MSDRDDLTPAEMNEVRSRIKVKIEEEMRELRRALDDDPGLLVNSLCERLREFNERLSRAEDSVRHARDT